METQGRVAVQVHRPSVGNILFSSEEETVFFPVEAFFQLDEAHIIMQANLFHSKSDDLPVNVT